MINSEANRQASWDWEYSSDQADPLGGPINREADWLRPAQRTLGRPSRPRPDKGARYSQWATPGLRPQRQHRKPDSNQIDGTSDALECSQNAGKRLVK